MLAEFYEQRGGGITTTRRPILVIRATVIQDRFGRSWESWFLPSEDIAQRESET